MTDNAPNEDDAPNELVATQEKFYCVSDSLKGLFGNKDKVWQFITITMNVYLY